MRHLARITLSLFIILSPALCRAENDTITHDFNALVSATSMTLTKTNTVGTVSDGIVYTCSNSAKFWAGTIGNTLPISINLPSSGSQVVTTKIDNLKAIIGSYYPVDDLSNIAIQLSTDGSTWDAALAGVSCKGGALHVEFPKGDYWVKISSTSGSYNVSLKTLQFVIETEFCNCFIYTP